MVKRRRNSQQNRVNKSVEVGNPMFTYRSVKRQPKGMFSVTCSTPRLVTQDVTGRTVYWGMLH